MSFKHQPRRPLTAWVLVADRARARVFSAEWPSLEGFHEIMGLAHPEGAAHQRDVAADGPGRFYESGGPRHAAEPETDFRHRTATEFAREIVGALQSGRDGGDYGWLVLVAPALFLGVLRGHLPNPLSRLVVADVDKDLTRFGAEDIRREVECLVAVERDA